MMDRDFCRPRLVPPPQNSSTQHNQPEHLNPKGSQSRILHPFFFRLHVPVLHPNNPSSRSFPTINQPSLPIDPYNPKLHDVTSPHHETYLGPTSRTSSPAQPQPSQPASFNSSTVPLLKKKTKITFDRPKHPLSPKR
ncbi:uncharacterized protein BO72DRAFT_302018 [Aspergillus fijiensis CBS 313.89]|uniref:Uncharacterized protein n=1 Tax=Aspergillus fijiensis CBS 313.89 TaxID=1448319 RepID=A0A8G1W1E5_9EURO|nr:uncharacterized protein BO72DRAFT_302018 [Aspergillus fijiensis CBS 313.89]RAK80327.1 hypothetical protein BO72DRAFT_302018 [Aspergillus fijiensis CBS 313.89]